MKTPIPPAGKVVLCVLGCVLLAIIIVWIPKAQVAAVPSAQRFSAENEARKTLVQLLGGLALLAGLWLTLRQVRASEITAASALDGQVTERFSRAVEHLGRDQLPTRLGGIYSLERIARDSVRDHWTAVEVLLAFVRANAPASDCHAARYSANEPASPPRPDVQAALTVIGRRSTNQDAAGILDLSKTDLRGADFRGLDFQRARFYGACLQSANFTGADVRAADFSAASVRGTVFTDARLDGADLITALTGGTYCQGATLVGTRVSEDNIRGLDALSQQQRGGLVIARWRSFDAAASGVVAPRSEPE